MRNCFVPGCDKKSKYARKRPMFLVPKEKTLFAKWTEALPKFRALKYPDRICSLHFQPHEIENSYQHIINGQLYQLERERVRLKPNAVPSQNLPSTEELLLLNKTRKPTINRATEIVAIEAKSTEIQTNQTTAQDVHDSTAPAQSLEVVLSEDVVIETATSVATDIVRSETLLQEQVRDLYNNFHDDIFEVVLPNTLWGMHRCPQRSIIVFSYMDTAQLQPTKMLTIDSNGAVKVYLATQLFNTLDMVRDVPTTNAITQLLAELDETRICAGFGPAKACELAVKTDNELCEHCLLDVHRDEVLFCVYDGGSEEAI